MSFTSYRETNYRGFLMVIGLVTAVEIVAAHILLVHFVSHLWAWIATLVALSSIVWLWFDWKGLQSHPTVLKPDRLELRFGARWHGEIPLKDVQSAERIEPFCAVPGADRPKGVFQLRLLGEPNVEMKFSRPVELRGPFGIKKRTQAIRMQIDEPDRFVEALTDAAA